MNLENDYTLITEGIPTVNTTFLPTLNILNLAETTETNETTETTETDEIADNTVVVYASSSDFTDDEQNEQCEQDEQTEQTERSNINININEFECGICSNTLFMPITLICQHNYCKPCALRWKEKTCPQCKVPYVVPKEYNRAFDIAVKQLFPTEYNERVRLETEEKLRENMRVRVERELREEMHNQIVASTLTDVNTEILRTARTIAQHSQHAEREHLLASHNTTIPIDRQPQLGNMIPAPNIRNITEEQHFAIQQQSVNVEHYIMLHLDMLGLRGIYGNYHNILLFIRRNEYYVSNVFYANIILWLINIFFNMNGVLLALLVILFNIPPIIWSWLICYCTLVIQQHLLRVNVQNLQMPVVIASGGERTSALQQNGSAAGAATNDDTESRYPVLERAGNQFLSILMAAIRRHTTNVE